MSDVRADQVQNVMQQFSPITRKFLAVAILFLTLFAVWSLVLSPIAAQMDVSLTKLSDARFQRERLEAIQARPEPESAEAIPAGMILRAKSREEANTQFGGYLSNIAAQNGLEITAIASRPDTKGSKLVAFDLALTGEEVGVAQFINTLERGNPVLRLRTWQIDSASIVGISDMPVDGETGGSSPSRSNIRFSGQIVGAWIKS